MKIVFVSILTVFLFACSGTRHAQTQETIRFNDSRIQFEGRVAIKNDASE